MEELQLHPSTLKYPTHYSGRMFKCENLTNTIASQLGRAFKDRIIDATVLIENLKDKNDIISKAKGVDEQRVWNLSKMGYVNFATKVIDECKLLSKKPDVNCSFLPDHNPQGRLINIKNYMGVWIIGWNIEGACSNKSFPEKHEASKKFIMGVLKHIVEWAHKRKNSVIFCMQEIVLKSDIGEVGDDNSVYNVMIRDILDTLKSIGKGDWICLRDELTGGIFYPANIGTVTPHKMAPISELSSSKGGKSPSFKTDISARGTRWARAPVVYADFQFKKLSKKSKGKSITLRLYNIHLAAMEGLKMSMEESHRYRRTLSHLLQMIIIIIETQLNRFLDKQDRLVVFCGDHNDEKIEEIYNFIFIILKHFPIFKNNLKKVSNFVKSKSRTSSSFLSLCDTLAKNKIFKDFVNDWISLMNKKESAIGLSQMEFKNLLMIINQKGDKRPKKSLKKKFSKKLRTIMKNKSRKKKRKTRKKKRNNK